MENFNTNTNNLNKQYINCGLANLGNSCFINSIIQILLNIPELNSILDDKNYRTKLNNDINGLLFLEWDLLREDMLKGIYECISPNRFLAVIRHVSRSKNKNEFAGYEQNDIQEFLLFLIDSFHLALKRNVIITITGNPETNEDKLAFNCYNMIKHMYEKDYSDIFNIFYGIHVSQITHNETNNIISFKPETFYSLEIPLPELSENKLPTLIECFDLYTSYEIMDGDNMYFYEEIGDKIIAKKNILFWSLPKILIIIVKRYKYTSRSMKLQQLLDFPLENLNLSKYIIGYDKNKYIYDLIGVCNHSGVVDGGHYTSFIKNQIDNNWYLCNDTKINLVENINHIITPKAYCLFYRMK